MSDSQSYTPESMLDEIALVYDNIIIERSGDAWAFFELRTETYDMLALQTKRELLGQMVGALNRMPAPGRAKIIVTRQDFDRKRYISGLSQVNPTSRRYKKWVSQIDDNLHTSRGSKRKVYLSVRLYADLIPAIKRAARGSWREARALGRKKILGHVSPIPDEEIARHKEAAEHIKDIFGPLLAPATPGPVDVAKLLRHLWQRGIAQDDLPAVGSLWESHEDSRVLIPCPEAWRALVADTAIYSYYNHLRLYHGDGSVTFQRFLGLSQMPTSGLEYPGDEYAYPKQDADIVLDFDLIPSYEAERQRQGKEQRLAAQEEHITGAGGKIDMGVSEARVAHREMEASFRSGQPKISLHATYCVSADTKQKLDEATKSIKDELAKSRITLADARGMNVEAFTDFLPAGKRRLKSYQVAMPPATLAGAAPGADSHVGDDQGPYIGLTRYTASPVCFDPPLAMKRNTMGSVGLFGSMGSGKSTAMYTFFIQLTMAGYWNILIDPKGDAKNLAKIPEIAENLHEVFIQPNAEVAMPILKLHPLSEIDKTYRVLRDFLIQLFGAQEGHTELHENKKDAVTAATQLFMKWFEEKDGNLSIKKLPDAFKQVRDQVEQGGLTEACSRLAYLLESRSQKDLSSIVLSDEGDVFGAGSGQGIAMGDARSIIFYTHELRLQRAEDRANGMEPTEEERIAQAVMSVVTAAAFELATRHRFEEKVFKAVHIDEAWQMLSNSTGVGLLNFLMREARSQWVGAFLASQKWSDIEGMAEHLGALFMGRNSSAKDVEKALRHMGVAPDKRSLATVDTLGDGHFIFQDIDKNVAPMYFEPVPHSWRRLLDTTPGKSKETSQSLDEGAALAGPR